VQSGSTKVLRAMQRTYSREEYWKRIAMMRGASRPIAITTDIIVAFRERRIRFGETLSF